MALDIGQWLHGLGLGSHARAFVDARIDADILHELGDADLKELGLPLGDRKRLLKAITALGHESAPDPEEARVTTPAARPREAERRQLTVMFVDLVGSSALSQRLDPEEMREVLKAYQNAVTGEISRLEGFTAKLMGDGVLAYFGWPKAHEDEAERAVRAGLAIVAAVAKLAAPEALACRVGIATGLVVVGDLFGEGASQEQAVVGDTPNLAARLQSIAASGQVVVAEATRRLVGDLFELTALAPQELRGIAGSVVAFVVGGERALESRFAARTGEGMAPIVGREQELALLAERWRQARAGEGQMVLLSGEAGIGKSRITQAMIDALAVEPHTRIRYQCSPHHTDSAFWPVIQQLTQAAGLAGDDPPALRLDKLESLLRRAVPEPGMALPLLAGLLGLDGEARWGRVELTPQQRRNRTLEALLDQLIGLADQAPVLLVLEDAHWIDPTTLELIELALDRVAGARVLMLVTARPTFQHAFGGHPIVTRLTLNRLGREQIMAIVRRLTGDKPLPEATLDEIAARTDGVPLYVEELSKAVIETGRASVPASLHDSLMARLDRIPEGKEVAQIAAVIGRSFDYRLLAAIADRPDGELLASLDRLAVAELIFRRGSPPEASFLFKHALVRDAAYESLLKRRRQELHGELALALEEHFPEIVRDQPELVAHHLTEARKPEAAVPYWQRAGERAARTSANAEAVAHLRQAIALLTGLPVSDEQQRLELQLQTQLAGALMATEGYGAATTAAAFARAHLLAELVGDLTLLFPVLYGQWVSRIVSAEHPGALEIAEQFALLARRNADAEPILVGHRIRGSSMFVLGRTEEASAELARGIALYRPDRHTDLAYQYGQDPLVAGLTMWALAQWTLGYANQSARATKEAIEHAKRGDHVNSLAYALYYAGIGLHYWLGNLDLVDNCARDLAVLAIRHGMAMWQAHSHVAVGWTSARGGEAATGVAMIQNGLTELKATGGVLWRPFTLLLLADAQLANGTGDDALATLDEALVGAVRQQELWLEPELHRRRAGVLLTLAGRAAEAEASLETALAIARHRQTRSWELRAACDLARLWAEQGERQRAHDLLAPVYGWFTEGFDTADLIEAKALLDELA